MIMATVVLPETGDELSPYSIEDRDALRELPRGVPITAQFAASRKRRSLPQLRMYWACCRTVAANTDDPLWNTKDKVHHQVRHALRWVDLENVTVFPDGTVFIPLKSISFSATQHLEACRFFKQAWPVMAAKLGITEEQLLEESERGYWDYEEAS